MQGFGYGAVILCGAAFQRLPLTSQDPVFRSYYPGRAKTTAPGLGCSPFARHYWGNHCCFLFLGVLRCFSSPRSPPRLLARMTALRAAGLSHSETRGSTAICAYPRLIAAYRVLHRLREPRHPPCALSYFLSTTRRQPCGTARAHTFSCTILARCPAAWDGAEKHSSVSTTVLLVQHVKDLTGCPKAPFHGGE